MPDLKDSLPSTKMSPEVKAKWLKALRSGKYLQSQAVLRGADNCYCCLGVLADIVDSSGWSPLAEESDEAGQDCYSYQGGMETMLTSTFVEQFGLPHRVARDLAEMNDEGKSFAYIADWIEANL